MKHGDKKDKAVKAAKHTSVKTKQRENGGKKTVAAKANGKRPQAGAKASAKASAKGQGAGGASRGSESRATESRKSAKRPGAEDVSFTNPAVAAAFKRSVKKFDTALRRLPD